MSSRCLYYYLYTLGMLFFDETFSDFSYQKNHFRKNYFFIKKGILSKMSIDKAHLVYLKIVIFIWKFFWSFEKTWHLFGNTLYVITWWKFLTEKLLIDEVVRKIYEEDARVRQREMEKKEEQREYILQFQQQQEQWNQVKNYKKWHKQ